MTTSRPLWQSGEPANGSRITDVRTATTFEAVVLAGGRAHRLGGVDKAAITLHGVRLVDRVVGAAQTVGAHRTIVVGPESTGLSATVVVQEDPPFTGPLAALAAAIPFVQGEWFFLLSCDLVRPDRVCELLSAPVISDDDDGLVLRDGDGSPQWLAGRYRSASVRSGLAELGESVDHASLRALLEHQRIRWIDAPSEVTADIDRPVDLDRARRSLEPRVLAESPSNVDRTVHQHNPQHTSGDT